MRLIAVLALVLMLAACGSDAAKKRDEAAAAQWRTGITLWSRNMTHAIDDLSVLFSESSTLHGLESGDRTLIARVGRSETALLTCRRTVTRLGLAPTGLSQIRDDALLACTNLQKGAKLVRAGIEKLQHGLGGHVLTESGEAFGSGQDALQRVNLELRHID